MKKYLTIFIILFAPILLLAQLTPYQALNQMGRGLNLGNTLEASPIEGSWAPKAQEHFFDDYQEAGFKTIRIPVRWYTRTGELAPYTLSSTFLDRVETVVDWALERDFIVIINCHHSDPLKEDYEGEKEKWDSIWSQVSNRFQHKSEKLFFEMMNEPNGVTLTEINDFNGRTLEIIRKTNPTRIVVIAGNGWSSSADLLNAGLVIPDDPYLIGTYHSYNPWSFGGEGKGTWGTSADKATMRNAFSQVKAWSDNKGIPVLLGEFGSTYVNDDGGDSDINSRFRHYAAYVEYAIKNKVAFTAWDDNGWFQVYIRESRKWLESKDILTHYSPESTTNFTAVIEDDSTVHLKWMNQAIVSDSITVERKRVGTESYETIGMADAGATGYIDSTLTIGHEYYYRVITHQADTAASFGYPQYLFTKPAVRSYYKGSPFEIPGVIEAEEFDNGIDGLTYHDMDQGNTGGVFRLDVDVDIEARDEGGYQVGWIEDGEWLEYSIDVKEAKYYYLSALVASTNNTGQFEIIFEKGRTRSFDVPSTGSWQQNTRLEVRTYLPKGPQVMRIRILKGSFNLDKIEFNLESGTAINNTQLRSIDVYPNPGNGQIKVSSADLKLDRAIIFDLRGKQVFEQKLNSSTDNQISLNTGLNSGTYLLNLYSGKQKYIERVIIK